MSSLEALETAEVVANNQFTIKSLLKLIKRQAQGEKIEEDIESLYQKTQLAPDQSNIQNGQEKTSKLCSLDFGEYFGDLNPQSIRAICRRTGITTSAISRKSDDDDEMCYLENFWNFTDDELKDAAKLDWDDIPYINFDTLDDFLTYQEDEVPGHLFKKRSPQTNQSSQKTPRTWKKINASALQRIPPIMERMCIERAVGNEDIKWKDTIQNVLTLASNNKYSKHQYYFINNSLFQMTQIKLND